MFVAEQVYVESDLLLLQRRGRMVAYCQERGAATSSFPYDPANVHQAFTGFFFIVVALNYCKKERRGERKKGKRREKEGKKREGEERGKEKL